MGVQNVTNEEIARYWKQRQLLVDDHLNAAITAAARFRDRNLSVSDDDDHHKFESKENENCSSMFVETYQNKETSIGIKNWWWESKYAYLNQPAMKLVCNDDVEFTHL